MDANHANKIVTTTDVFQIVRCVEQLNRETHKYNMDGWLKVFQIGTYLTILYSSFNQKLSSQIVLGLCVSVPLRVPPVGLTTCSDWFLQGFFFLILPPFLIWCICLVCICCVRVAYLFPVHLMIEYMSRSLAVRFFFCFQ